MIVGICSGYFNPIAKNHIKYLRASATLCDYLVVIVNNDDQVKLKNSIPFMGEIERLEIARSIRYVNEAKLSRSKTSNVAIDIQKIVKQYNFDNNTFVFFNGGDQNLSNSNSAEAIMCKVLGVEQKYEIGGNTKIQSSSSLIENVAKEWNKRQNQSTIVVVDTIHKSLGGFQLL